MDAKSLGTIVDSTVASDPQELTVVGGAAANASHEHWTVGTVLVKIDHDGRVGCIPERVPANRKRFVAFPVLIKIGAAENQVGLCVDFGRRSTISARIGDGGTRKDVNKRTVQIRVVGRAGLSNG